MLHSLVANLQRITAYFPWMVTTTPSVCIGPIMNLQASNHICLFITFYFLSEFEVII